MYFEIVGPISDVETIAVAWSVRQLAMPTREKGFAICVENRGADDLDVHKVYRVLHDKDAAATGYVRVIDESGEDYLYPADYFVFVKLPQKAKRAWAVTRRAATPRRSATKPLRRIGTRLARSGR